jgi:hypothetical protein
MTRDQAIEKTVECFHCGSTMEWVLGPGSNVPVNTYWARCKRLDLESRRDKPSTIYPQRCGDICFRSLRVEQK